MVSSPKRQDQQSLLAEIKQALTALGNKTFFSVVVGSGGITIKGGRIKIVSSGGIQLPLGGTITDAQNNIMFSADASTGQRLSTPFFAIPMTAMWDGQDGSAFRTGGSTGGYVIQAQHCMTETTLWRGIIPQVLHPKISYNIDVGRLTGTTSTPTYRLYCNGTLVDTFTSAPQSQYTPPGRDITGITIFGTPNVQVAVTVQSNISSTDYFDVTCWEVLMVGN